MILKLALLALPSVVVLGSEVHTLGTGDLSLSGGASYIPGHGAPTGMSIRTGNPGQHSAASFKLVLAPGSTLTSIAFAYRYISGYGPSGIGTNLSLSITGSAVPGGRSALYGSPHYTDYSYDSNHTNYI